MRLTDGAVAHSIILVLLPFLRRIHRYPSVLFLFVGKHSDWDYLHSANEHCSRAVAIP